MTDVLPGYQLGALLRRTPTATAYEAVRKDDRLPVVAELYTAVADEGAEARFEHEYRLLRDLDVAGAARAVDLLRDGTRQVLVFERCAGVDLRQFAAERPPELETCLDLAVRITRILAEVHARRVVHRGLNPASILVDPRTTEVCLAGFGISFMLERNHRQIYGPGVLHDALPYISPEQTGRTGRGVDHRSDLYSLGVVFYELLAGRRPFETDDPMALVHAHLAREPEPVHVAEPSVPEVLSHMVDRLLAKDPADRYQSARSLLHDLERCAADLVGGAIEPFEIAAGDLSETLQLPSRLYGREAELRKLFAAFERACDGGAETLLIRGEPGAGKTALVEELQRPVAGRGGYFAAGKFELHRSDVPFLALRQALTALAELLLVEDDESLALWRVRILEGVGSLGGVLVELAPKLGAVLGPQPPPMDVGPLESRNRLRVAVSRLLAAVASTDRPLVLFFDDLQWSDSGSLDLLEHLLVEDGPEALLLLGAYRGAEDSPRGDDLGEAHPLPALLERLAARNRAPATIALGPLPPEAVTELIADALSTDAERARSLAASLAGRTHDNPLLVRQLLLFLADDGLLERGPSGWSWSEEAVRTAGIPEDAVDAVQAKVARLPRELREILVAASCLGSRVDLPSLAAALEARPAELLGHFAALCDQGLLTESEDGYRFSHNRIEEAAARDLEPELERAYHERIGRFRRQATAEDELPGRVFEIADHLNWVVATEEDPACLLDLARLDHLAGVRAFHSASYAAAQRYLAAGVEALKRAAPESGGSEHLELGLALGIDLARSLALAGRHGEAARIFDELGSRDLDALAVGRICTARAETSYLAGRNEDAVRWGLHGLARLGLHVPRSPSAPRLAALLLRLRWTFRGGNVQDRILTLPQCRDPHALVRMELFWQMAKSAYLREGRRRFFLAVNVHWALEVMRHGRSPSAGMVLIAVAVILEAVFGDRSRAEQLTVAAIEMSRGGGSNVLCRTIVAAHFSVLHWVRPLRDSLTELESAFEVGREEGDVEYAALALIASAAFGATAGLHLDTVKRSAERAARYCADVGMVQHEDRQQCTLRVCDALSGRREIDPDQPDPLGALASEEPLRRCKEVMWQMQLLLVLEAPRRAFDLGEAVAAEADRVLFPIPNLPEFVFFHGLAAAACHAAAGREGSRRSTHRLWKVLFRAHRRLKGWARHCEANFAHKALALEAEMARLRGGYEEALDLYEQAARSAEEHGFHHLQALVLERLGRFAQSREWHHVAGASLGKARDLYAAWGAKLKVERMDSELPELRLSRPPREAAAVPSSSGTTVLDLATVLKTSQAISEEIRLGRVVEQVMAAAIENAGAQRGVLLLERGGQLGVAAEGAVGTATTRHDPELPLERSADRLVLSAVRLAARTGESVVVADAARDERFAADPYVTANGARSIACFPILREGRRSGLLYLENNLAPAAFTAERADVLRVLSAQAAISLDNARLYEDLRGARDRLAEQVEEQLRIDAAREKLLAELEASNAELERFVYTASHDLKTPLITIRGFLGLLRQDAVEGRTERLDADMRVIEEATEKMYRLLDEILELSRAGRLIQAPEAMGLNDLVAQALRLVAPQLEGRGVKVAVARHLPTVVVDRRRFVEVLYNLLENAVGFMGEQPAPRIEISAVEEPERTVVTVADNGIGIEAAYHEKVFGLFERLDASSPGTGMGLALVKRIVEAHGGRIWVESEGRGSGSRFVMALPRPPA